MYNFNGIKDILSDKKPDVAEIELTLFENCDISCAFCAHEKDSIEGMSRSEILSKTEVIRDFIAQVKDDSKFINLHILGGELFQDRLLDDDHMLESYKLLVDNYSKLCTELQVKPRIIFVSGFHFKNKEKVKDFITHIKNIANDISFIVSYDLHGRPKSKFLKDNLIYLNEHISNVNMVMTNKTLEKMMTKSDSMFDFLYQEFPIFIDEFLPDKQTEYLIPSDTLILDWLKFIKTEYPKLMPWHFSVNLIEKGELNTPVQFAGSTVNKCTVLPNNKVTNYLWERHKAEYFKGNVNYEDNTEMLFNFVMENNCLSCEYYKVCPLRCPVAWSWENRERAEGCVNKKFFNSIRSR